MPDLKNDNFYNAALLLVESELGAGHATVRYKDALSSLKGSSYRDTSDYAVIVSGLKRKLKDGASFLFL